MYKEILVPLDGSELAEAAVPHAIELAKAFNASVTLLSVVEPVGVHAQPGAIGPVVSVTLNIEEEMDRIREYLHGVAERYKDYNVEIKKVVREGDPASIICDYAHETNADLIVMSTHGRSGIQRWVYGSVADRVLRAAKIPILLIRVQSS